MSSLPAPHPRSHATRHPRRAALIVADVGTRISYAELVEQADRAASLFDQLGLREGDTIALWLENHHRYPELMWAAKNSGLTYACVSSQSSVDDACYIIANCDARLLIASARLAPKAQAVAQRLGPRLKYLMLDGSLPPFADYETLRDRQPARPPTGRRRGPSMLYSSGTTGRPKGVRAVQPDEPPEVPPPRHGMLVRQYGFDADSVLVNPGPFYHAAPGRFMMCVQRCGGTVVGFRKFDAEALLRAIQDHRATHALLVPTMFVRLLRLDPEVRARYDLSSLRCVVHLGAPCPVPVKRQMIDWLGPIIEELYAGTESIGHTFISSAEWLAHPGSVGRPAAGCAIRIVDDHGRPCPPGVPGLVQMNNGRRFEYHKDPDKTRGAIGDDGWGTLDDVGYLDEEGYLYLTDRRTHMIISGGVNIYPQEAENLLSGHPAVADVAVIGVPDAEFGEAVRAVVEPVTWPVDDPESLAAELIGWCRSGLSAIKCPRDVDFVESLPRNEAGKLLKRELRERYWEAHDRLIG